MDETTSKTDCANISDLGQAKLNWIQVIIVERCKSARDLVSSQVGETNQSTYFVYACRYTVSLFFFGKEKISSKPRRGYTAPWCQILNSDSSHANHNCIKLIVGHGGMAHINLSRLALIPSFDLSLIWYHFGKFQNFYFGASTCHLSYNRTLVTSECLR